MPDAAFAYSAVMQAVRFVGGVAVRCKRGLPFVAVLALLCGFALQPVSASAQNASATATVQAGDVSAPEDQQTEVPALDDDQQTPVLDESIPPGADGLPDEAALDQLGPLEEETATPSSSYVHEEPNPKWVDTLFKGSFLGSLFFSYPYSGVGTPDLVVMGIAFLLAVRLVLRRLQGNEEHWPGDRRARERMSQDERASTGKRGTRGAARARASTQTGPVSQARPVARERETPSEAYLPESGTAPGSFAGESRGYESANAADSYASGGYASGAAQQRESLGTNYSGGSSGYGSANAVPYAAEVPGQWASIAPGVVLPPDFDSAYFLEWSRSLYIALQYSWAARQVDDLAPYVSLELLTVLQNQAARDPYPVEIEILSVGTILTDIRHQRDRVIVSMNFTVAMRTGNNRRIDSIKELWRFACGGGDSSWRLIAIEQA